MATTTSTILGLDVGSRRVGVAAATLAARLPRPLTTLARDDNFFLELQTIIDSENVSRIVIGLPRNLSGQSTAQTKVSEDFADELKSHYDLPIHLQDEAVTSKQAEAELQTRRGDYKRGDIDALAATYILEDFLAENQGLA